MGKIQNLSEIMSKLMDQTQKLNELTSQVSQLGSTIQKISGELSKYDQDSDTAGGLPGYSSIKTPTFIEFNNYKVSGSDNAKFSENESYISSPKPSRSQSITEGRFFSGSKMPAYYPNNIIQFPGSVRVSNQNTKMTSYNAQKNSSRNSAPFLAIPGTLLPSEITDYRPYLQRNGLILLAWDKRETESGNRYTAYWVTSTGIPRFYASKPLSSKDFPSARPIQKSYAAEDGIEFYGQKAPLYIVHVAPELMKSNPRHGELRTTHIKILKSQGSKVDFNYQFLLKTEKSRDLPLKRSRDENQNQADA